MTKNKPFEGTQANSLEHSQPHPVLVVAVTSGKGGVGKTNTSVNLALALAQANKSVLLLDADLGLANVDVVLGLTPQYNLSHVLQGEHSLEEVMIKGPLGIQIIPASSGTQSMTQLTPQEHAGLIQAFNDLTIPLDVLIIDTAAGISESVTSFVQASQEVLVVVCDEPTSITDAYASIKVLSRDYHVDKFHIVANMVEDEKQGYDLFMKLYRVSERFLDVTLEFLGAIPYDDLLRKAVQKQKAVMDAYPNALSSRAFKTIATRMTHWSCDEHMKGNVTFFLERLLACSSTTGVYTERE